MWVHISNAFSFIIKKLLIEETKIEIVSLCMQLTYVQAHCNDQLK